MFESEKINSGFIPFIVDGKKQEFRCESSDLF